MVKVENIHIKEKSTDGLEYEFDRLPHPSRNHLFANHRDADEILNRNIAHIEALKIKAMEWPGLDEKERQTFFQELDSLRGAFVQYAMLSRSAAIPSQVQHALKQPNIGRNELKLKGIIGQSPGIKKILRIISKIASTDITVLMEGETGSGKELFARIIHLNSDRENFIAVNCGAFPSGLIESELFGHVKGAFTGASGNRKGKFEEANGGTIFLDECGELEMPAQVKLLRVLEEGEIQRVGSDTTYRTNVRVIAATNRDLTQMVADGTFREDLYYRLSICPFIIPPLRQRRDEIRVLSEYFMQEACAPLGKQLPVISKELQKFIYEQYDFPGNIRELKNIIYYLAHISDGGTLSLRDLPEHYYWKVKERQNREAGSGGSGAQLQEVRAHAEKEFILNALEAHKGNIAKVCRETGLSRSRLYQLFNKYGIEPTNFR